jgi:hypothetical protein
MSIATQALAASFPAIVKDMRGGAHNQWGNNAFLKALQRKGFIEKTGIGSSIDVPLDFQANASAQVLATDFGDSGLTQTEILSAATYAPAPVSASRVWTKMDEAKNSSKQQKVNFVKQLGRNLLDSHDNLMETVLADTTSQSLLGVRSVITEDGTGTIGGVVAGTDTWWKNAFAEYTDSTDLLAKLTAGYVAVQRGAGSSIGGSEPTLILTNTTSYGVFFGTQVTNQRFVNTQKADVGFDSLGFINAEIIFSNKVDTTDEAFYMLSPDAIKLVVSSEFYRALGDVAEINGKQAYEAKLFTVCQLVLMVRNATAIVFS